MSIYDVFVFILDSNSILTKDPGAFQTLLSKYTRPDSTIVVLSANESVERVVAGVRRDSITALPPLHNTPPKADDLNRVINWIIEAQVTRETEGNSAEHTGVWIDCGGGRHSALIAALKANAGLTVLQALNPEQNSSGGRRQPPGRSNQPAPKPKPVIRRRRKKHWKAIGGVIVLALLLLCLISGKLPNPISLISELKPQVSLKIHEISLELGRTCQLAPEASFLAGRICYASSDESVAVVSEDGLITATSQSNSGEARTAVITAYSRIDENIKDTVQVTVLDSYYAACADEPVIYKGSQTCPYVFLNTVPQCTGFTVIYTLKEIREGSPEDLVGVELLVAGCSGEGDWVELGSFLCGELQETCSYALTFPEIDLDRIIIAVENNSTKATSWTYSAAIQNLQYQD